MTSRPAKERSRWEHHCSSALFTAGSWQIVRNPPGALAIAFAVLLVTAMTHSVLAAELDPKLNPPAAPGPTMKSLDQIPPSWDQVLPAAERFKLVMGGDAVLDKETGLVWERSPNPTQVGNLDGAHRHCIYRSWGNRKGWRLPTLQELASLTLLPGHPFLGVTSHTYWTATLRSTSEAWAIESAGGNPLWNDVSQSAHAWCMRGGRGADLQ